MKFLTPYVNELKIPPVLKLATIASDESAQYLIVIRPGKHQIHRGLPPIPDWGFEGTYPGPTIETHISETVIVEFTNDLTDTLPFSIEPEPMSIHHGYSHVFLPNKLWTVVVHLHGNPSAPSSDGWLDNA
jgi:FtsP/CotA-like multicopper oxidase with cupredoxin domain